MALNFKNSGRICVLDDEKSFLTVAKNQLSKYLPEIQSFFINDPEVAFEIASEDVQTIFVIDMNLGDSNGMDIYRKISHITKKSRVIFITGDAYFLEDEDIRRQTLSEGGIDFVEKPIRWHEMAIKIRNHLNILDYQFELEGKVEERTQQLIHADRLATVGTMVSSIVHEISSPLTFIKANQETFLYAYNKIKDDLTDPEAKKVFENYIIPGVADSLSGIARIEELLKSFRRFYKREHRISENDILSIINEVKNLTYYSIKKNSVAFSVTSKNNGTYSIKCNRQELVQVITNIVNNAIDALEDNNPGDREIKIAIDRIDTKILIIVSNNGPAIPERDVENIFNPFFTTKGEANGTGLGLAIVRQIIKGMGGDVELSNRTEKKKSVDFIINLPVNQDPKDNFSYAT